MKIKKPVHLILLIGICQMAGIIGSMFTTQAIPTWYLTLNKPSFSPPNWIFGPVWITLYVLMGMSIYLIMVKKSKNKKNLVNLFFIHLALNTIWSIIFFGLQNPGLAFIEIVILWGMIAVLMIRFYSVSKVASYLLIPYFAWVSFASLLNYSIWILN